MTAVCYVRVSTVEQAQGYSLKTQEAATVRLARELGAETIEVLCDTFTGTELDRPAMNVLRSRVRSRQCQLVVMYDIDRFGRDLTDILIVLREIDRAGVVLRFVSVGWENTPNGRMLLQMRGAIAEFEHAQILERTRRGKTAKAAQGKLRTFAQPYGYRFDKQTANLSRFEPEAQWVRRVFHWCAEDSLTTYQIARRLAELGVPGPKGPTWDHTQVLRMLRSRTYAGRLVRKDERPEWAPILVPAVVDEEMWQRAQWALERSKRFAKRRTAGEFLLRRLLRCGNCGRMLTVASTGAAGRRWHYYICRGRYPTKFGPAVARCTTPPIRTDTLDALVWHELWRAVADAEAYAAELVQVALAEREPLALKRKEAQARLDQAARAVARLHRAYAAGTIAADDHGRLVAEFQAAAANAGREVEAVARAVTDSSRLEPTADGLRTVAARLVGYETRMPFAARQRLVRLIVDTIVVASNGGLEVQGAVVPPAAGNDRLLPEAASIEKHAVTKLARDWETGGGPTANRRGGRRGKTPVVSK